MRRDLSNKGVEDADLPPVLFELFDEFEVAWGLLVEVVVMLRGEDDMEAHVELLVVDVAVEILDAGAGSKEGDAWMVGEASESEASSGWVGQHLTSAGDVDGDGVDDVLVPAIREQDSRGAVYVLFGQRTL